MITRNRMIGLAIACVAVGAFFLTASTPASANDGRLTVTPAVYRTESSTPGPTTQFVGYGYYGRGWGPGYRGYGGYGWGGYGYRPYYRPYFYGGYPAVGYGYRAYGYGYPGYGYGYPGYGYGYYGPRVGVGIGVW
jgi:hypothetical protein